MRHLSTIACWHLNYDKIADKGGVGLIKVVSVQKFQFVAQIERRFIVTAENARKKSDLVKICGHFLDKYDCNDR